MSITCSQGGASVSLTTQCPLVEYAPAMGERLEKGSPAPTKALCLCSNRTIESSSRPCSVRVVHGGVWKNGAADDESRVRLEVLGSPTVPTLETSTLEQLA